jgi:sugar phosphate isomerase/epimerase
MTKVGTYISGDLPFEDRVRILKSTGFDFGALGLSLFSTEGDELEQAVRLCEKHDFPIDNIHLTGAKTTALWDSDPLGDEICDRYCREIARASAAGIRVGVAHITWGHSAPAPVGEIGFSRMERIAECAAKHDFILSLENSVYLEHLYATMERLKDCTSVGFTFDSGHRNAFAPEYDFLSDFGDRLAVTHIADNDGVHDLHLMPMDGSADWNYVANGLAKTVVGRDRILAEPSLGAFKKMKGIPAGQIRRNIVHMPIAAEPELLVIEDEKFSAYSPLTYEQKMERLYVKMRRLADMIEAASK